MSWKQHTSRGHSEEVEDSIQYLRRYLGDEKTGGLHPATSPPGNKSNNNDSNSPVAAGVVPNTVARGDWGAPGHSRESSGSTLHGRPPIYERGSDSNSNSRLPPFSTDGYDVPPPLRRGDGIAQVERRHQPREYGGRTVTSPLREPLQLHYGSANQSPAGRPPLHGQQQQQQQQQKQQTDASARRSRPINWRDEEGDNNNNALRRHDEKYARGWQHETSDARWANRQSSWSHPRRSHTDPCNDTRPFNGASASGRQHRRHHRLGDEGLVDDVKEEEQQQQQQQEEEENERSVAMERRRTPTRASDVRRSHYTTHDRSPNSNATTASVTGAASPAGRHGTPNGHSASARKTNINSNHNGSKLNSRAVFPYPVHEDNLRSIIFYLKNNYALEPEESLRGIETMTPEDALGLAQCFYVDMYRTVRHARDAAGVGRAGFTDRDPDVDCVVSPANDRERWTTEEDDAANIDGGDDARRDEGGRADAGSLPPPKPSGVTLVGAPRRSPPRQAQYPHPQQYQQKQKPQKQQQQQQQHAKPRTIGDVEDTRRPPHDRSQSLTQHDTSRTHSAHDHADSSVLTAGTSLSIEAPPEPRSGILRRPLRELMPLLRRGSTLCKHVVNGRPHLRFFRVIDRVGTYRGEEALMPHFSWFPTASDKSPTEVLNLLSLVGVHLLLADNAGRFHKLFRRKKGVIVDHSRRPVANGMCAVFHFERRDVAVSFMTEEDRQLWVGGMMGVVERNREVASRANVG